MPYSRELPFLSFDDIGEEILVSEGYPVPGELPHPRPPPLPHGTTVDPRREVLHGGRERQGIAGLEHNARSGLLNIPQLGDIARDDRLPAGHGFEGHNTLGFITGGDYHYEGVLQQERLLFPFRPSLQLDLLPYGPGESPEGIRKPFPVSPVSGDHQPDPGERTDEIGIGIEEEIEPLVMDIDPSEVEHVV